MGTIVPAYREGDVGAWVLLCRPIGRVMWVHGYYCAGVS